MFRMTSFVENLDSLHGYKLPGIWQPMLAKWVYICRRRLRHVRLHKGLAKRGPHGSQTTSNNSVTFSGLWALSFRCNF